MNERLDMDAINRQYFEKRGFTKSNKNQAADYFLQLAVSLGFSLDLLKEDWNRNKRYSFDPADVELINDMLDRLKSREGKRLRCRDYQGAGGAFVHHFIDDILHLFRSNGVSETILWEQQIMMHVLSEYTGLTAQAVVQRAALKDYVGRLLFVDSPYAEMDGFSQMDQYVYWSYLIEHPEIDIDEALGIYWCWWDDHFNTRYEKSYQLRKRIRGLSDEERDVLDEIVAEMNYFERLVENDSELQEALSQWRTINYGGGKLKDNPRLVQLEHEIAERFSRHLSDAVGSPPEHQETPTPEPDYPYAALYQRSMQYLLEARELYHKRVEAAKQRDPIFGDRPSAMAIAYERRFLRPLVPR